MRYFLTGATGFIGRSLARQLREAGHDVVALVRSPERARDLEEAGVELAPGDITRPETLPDAMAACDGVFHVAGWYNVGQPDRRMAEAINVTGTRNVLEAAGEAGVERVVYTSTVAVYGDTGGREVDESYRSEGPWLSEYDRSKWLAHYEVAEPMMEQGLPLVIVQPGVVYGPNDHSRVGAVLRDYLRRRLPVIPSQGACWSFVDDMARGHIQAMDRGTIGKSYNLSGPCLRWDEVLATAEELTGIPRPRIVLPPIGARLAAWLMTPIARLTELPATYHPETLRVAAGTTYFSDDSRARRELGWDPRPLEEGLAVTLDAEMEALQVRLRR